MMSDVIFRYANERDLPALKRIWALSFGDSEELAEEMLRDKDVWEHTVVAAEGAPPCAMMTAFDGLRFGSLRTSYLYALCTHPAHRGMGIGQALTLACAREAFARGSDAVCLHPASQTLAGWYGRMGFQSVAAPGYTSVAASSVPQIKWRALTPEEYAEGRSGLADPLPASLLRVQDLLCRESGGGFYAAELDGSSVLFCAEHNGRELILREVLCPGLDPLVLASAAAAAFDKESALYRDCRTTQSETPPHLMFLAKEEPPALPSRALLPFLLD